MAGVVIVGAIEAPDGRRFLMLKSEGRFEGGSTAAQIVVVLNWEDEVRRLAPR